MEQSYVDRYRLVKKLGSGGMGTVYQAWDDSLKRDVALKIPNSRDAGEIDRLRRESDVLAQLQHRSIVSIYGSGSTLEIPFYMVMEFVDGLTIEQLLRHQGGTLPLPAALKVALRVAQALAYAHQRPKPVIHRDIKPGNILIRYSDSEIKVADFGIAAVGRRGITIVGTLGYVAPEQAGGRGADERSDLYSLGVLLYELLMGELPLVIAGKSVTAPSVRLGSLSPEVARRLDHLALGLLRQDPQDRMPQQAEEVALKLQELRTLLAGMPAPSVSQPQGGASPADVPVQPPPKRPTNAPQTPSFFNAPTEPASKPVGLPFSPTLYNAPTVRGSTPDNTEMMAEIIKRVFERMQAGGFSGPVPVPKPPPATPQSQPARPPIHSSLAKPVGSTPGASQPKPLPVPQPKPVILPEAPTPRLPAKAPPEHISFQALAACILGIIAVALFIDGAISRSPTLDLLALLAALVTVVVGHQARHAIRQSQGMLGGGGAAGFALMLGYLMLVFYLLAAVVFFTNK